MSKIGAHILDLEEQGLYEPPQEAPNIPCEEGDKWVLETQKADKDYQMEDEDGN